MRQPGYRAPAPGPLALVQNLINTVDLETGRDNLCSVTDLRGFCNDHKLGQLTFDDAAVENCRRLREALRDACQAHTGVDLPVASQNVLDELFDTLPLTLAVDSAGRARAAPAAGQDGLPALNAHLACAILTAVAEGTWHRLKACAAHECRWVYYDKSPGGRSRWCTMSICGSRAKMRAYRSRHGAASHDEKLWPSN